MANKSLRCVRAEGVVRGKSKSISEVLEIMEQYELMYMLRAKRGGELNHLINNQSRLSRENSEITLEGIDDGQSPSLLSSIEDREDLDYHDELFVRNCDLSSNYSSDKSSNIRMGISNSSDAMRLDSNAPIRSSSSDNLFNHRESGESSMLMTEELPSSKSDNKDILANKKGNKATAKGVSVSGSLSKMSNFLERKTDNNRGGGVSEAQSFFSRAITGIRSGSQSNVITTRSSSMSDSLACGSSGSGADESEEKHMDFFSRALTGIRGGPQRSSDDESKAKKLENKLQQMTKRSRRFDNRLKELEKKISNVEANPIDISKPKPKQTQSIKSEDPNIVISHMNEEAKIGMTKLVNPEEKTKSSFSEAPKNDTDIMENGNNDFSDRNNENDVHHNLSYGNDTSGDNVSGISISSVENSGLHDEDFKTSDNTDRIDIDSESVEVPESQLEVKNPELEVKKPEEVKNRESHLEVKNPESQLEAKNPESQLEVKNPESQSEVKNTESPLEVKNPELQLEIKNPESPLNDKKTKEYSYNELRRKSTVVKSGKSGASRRSSISQHYPSDVLAKFSQREELLKDDEFQQIFGMNKDTFYGLPKWRQQDLKKRHKLF